MTCHFCATCDWFQYSVISLTFPKCFRLSCSQSMFCEFLGDKFRSVQEKRKRMGRFGKFRKKKKKYWRFNVDLFRLECEVSRRSAK